MICFWYQFLKVVAVLNTESPQQCVVSKTARRDLFHPACFTHGSDFIDVDCVLSGQRPSAFLMARGRLFPFRLARGRWFWFCNSCPHFFLLARGRWFCKSFLARSRCRSHGAFVKARSRSFSFYWPEAARCCGACSDRHCRQQRQRHGLWVHPSTKRTSTGQRPLYQTRPVGASRAKCSRKSLKQRKPTRTQSRSTYQHKDCSCALEPQ